MKKEPRKNAVLFTTGCNKRLHTIGRSAHIFLIICLIMIGFGCSKSKSTSPEEEPYATIEILQNGVVQDSIVVKEENDGDIYPVYDGKSQIGEIEVEYIKRYNNCNPNLDPTIYFFTMGRKNGSYTIFKNVSPFDTLRFDYQLDFDPVNESLNCGIMYQQGYGYVRDEGFSVWLDSVFVDSIFTDSIGRFETAIEPDSFYLTTTAPYSLPEIEFILQEGYADYFIGYYVVEEKPNIYLYPENTIELDVSISFPQTGEVITSDPQYPEKWKSITVEPDGTINGQYRYLFYESMQPNFYQRSKGWIVNVKELESFFRENMKDAGFVQPEIDDFIEYWIPRLTDSKYYALYPQYNEQLDPLIQLNFSIQPDNILRVIYAIEEVESDDMKLEEPKIPQFERKGFVVAEWGVVID